VDSIPYHPKKGERKIDPEDLYPSEIWELVVLQGVTTQKTELITVTAVIIAQTTS
jgi:hypothetical protein